MSRNTKSLIARMFVLFILPLALGVCCCLGEVFASPSASSQGHCQLHPQAANHEQASDKSGSGRSCEHDLLIADMPSVTSLGAQLPAVLHFLKDFAPEVFPLKQAQAKKLFFSIGPPGSLFSTKPLYLQLSVLRI